MAPCLTPPKENICQDLPATLVWAYYIYIRAATEYEYDYKYEYIIQNDQIMWSKQQYTFTAASDWCTGGFGTTIQPEFIHHADSKDMYHLPQVCLRLSEAFWFRTCLLWV